MRATRRCRFKRRRGDLLSGKRGGVPPHPKIGVDTPASRAPLFIRQDRVQLIQPAVISYTERRLAMYCRLRPIPLHHGIWL